MLAPSDAPPQTAEIGKTAVADLRCSDQTASGPVA